MAEAPPDLAILLGRALRSIRERSTRTGLEWQARTGMSQSYLSAAELGKSGWESIRNIAAKVERAGEDPLDLLRLALAEVDHGAEARELLALWGIASPELRTAILTLLRAQAEARAAVR